MGILQGFLQLCYTDTEKATAKIVCKLIEKREEK